MITPVSSQFGRVAPRLDERPILIGFADALSAPECAWSLLDAGYNVAAYASAGSRPPLRRSKQIEVTEIPSPRVDLSGACSALARILDSGRFSAVMPLDDDSVWLCSAVARRGAQTPILGPIGERAELALDKRLQFEAAARAGLIVPATMRVESRDEILSLTEFPIVLKPALALVERRNALARPTGRVCANRSELVRVAQGWGGEPLVAQPLVLGVGEGLFGIAGPAGIRAVSAHRRIRMMNPQGSGSSACRSTPVDADLAAAAERMLRDVDWHGLFMLEFLRDPAGRAWFMELNGRPWGSMALARRSGLEYPAWAARRLAEPEFEPSAPPFTEHVCRHLGRELVHLMMVMRGPRSEALTAWPSRVGAVRDVLRFRQADDWYNWRPGDRTVFLEDTVQTVARQIARAFA